MKNSKFKKLATVTLVVIMAFSSGTVVHAGEIASNYDFYNYSQLQFISESEIQLWWDNAASEAFAAITPEQLEYVASLSASMHEIENAVAMFYTFSLYNEIVLDDNCLLEVLTNFNFQPNSSSFLPLHWHYARLFSLHDGLSASHVTLIQTFYSQRADAISQNFFVDTHQNMQRDAYRHFLWNWLITSSLGYRSARVHTSNHEIASSILRRSSLSLQQAFDTRFNQLIAQGSTVAQATAGAEAARDAMAINLRQIMLQNTNLVVFHGYFNGDEVMDLINNAHGRQSFLTANHFIDEPQNVFVRLWNSGDIIRNSHSAITPTLHNMLFNTGLWRP